MQRYSDPMHINVEDAQIVAIARSGGLTLATRNTKDFSDIVLSLAPSRIRGRGQVAPCYPNVFARHDCCTDRRDSASARSTMVKSPGGTR